MYIRRKVFSTLIDEMGEEKMFSTTEIEKEFGVKDSTVKVVKKYAVEPVKAAGKFVGEKGKAAGKFVADKAGQAKEAVVESAKKVEKAAEDKVVNLGKTIKNRKGATKIEKAVGVNMINNPKAYLAGATATTAAGAGAAGYAIAKKNK